MEVYLVFGGKTGWIGQIMVSMLKAKGKVVHIAESRLEDREACAREIDGCKATHVVNCAGLTGRPNVDWCEDHKQDVLRVNVMGTLSLLDLCETRGIHITNFATGCIYNYDATHTEGGKPFKEEDAPNYIGSYYSRTKAWVDGASDEYKHALTLRLRMPISDDLNPRSFITKISAYARVINSQNSVTVLTDLLPVAIAMMEAKVTGKYNFTNPGTVSHNECLEFYKKYVDNNFWWENFTEAEQSKILKAGRCNNYLDTTKLEETAAKLGFPHLPDAKTGVRDSMIRLKADADKRGEVIAPRKAPKA